MAHGGGGIGGNVLHHVKREGELSGRGKCPGEHVRGIFPDHGQADGAGRTYAQSVICCCRA